ncbi:MAG: restriction endonuclease subunit S, partial [Terriglobia bacterium]
RTERGVGGMSVERVAPTGWDIAKLEDVVDILDSKRVPVNAKERETRVGQVPYYGATGQVGWIDDYLFDEELVLLGEDGAPFLEAARQKAYIIRGKSWVNNHAHVLKARSDIPNAYIKYYLDTVDYHEFVTGTTRLKLNQAAMRQIPVPLAPSEERASIVAEIEKQFSRLDEAVANLTRVKANLKRYKAAVLKAAVEGKLTEDWRKQHPNIEPASKLLERILAERRAKWKGRGKYKEPAKSDTSNLPTLPERWTWTNLDQLAEVGTGATPKRGKSQYYSGGHIPWVTSSALNKEHVDKANEFVTDVALRETNLSLYSPGTLLLAMYGEGRTRGKCSMLRIHATTNQAIAAIQCTDEVRDYLKLAIWNQYEDLRRIASGGVQPNLNLSLVRSITIPLPPISEQQFVVAEVERRLSVIDELEATVEANLKRADRLRQATLQKAFSGKLLLNGAHR